MPSGVGEYGVGIGTFVRFTRDDADDFGSFFHGHIDLRVPDGSGGFGTLTSAIDVNKPDGGVGYFHLSNLDVSNLTTVTALGAVTTSSLRPGSTGEVAGLSAA